MKRTEASRARARLQQTERAREEQVEALLQADAMVAGSFVRQTRTCGKSGCRCTRGERHVATYLSRSVGGVTQMVYVPGGDEVAVSTKADRYRRFREARAALMKLASETAQAADALQVALTEPYPKGERRRRPSRKR